MSDRVHDTAHRGFDRAAAEYERGRPGFPADAIALLARELPVRPGDTVLDLAAGTGKLTRALAPLGARLIAVEPVAGMREQLIATTPGVEVLDGTAEAIPLADASVDAAFVAQAFHWFDIAPAAAEIRRVLRAHGGLGVLYNRWDTTTPWVSRMQDAVHALRGDTPSRDSPWKSELEATGLFTPLHGRTTPHVPVGDAGTVLARVASISYVSVLDKGRHDELLRQVAEILEADPVTQSAEFELPHVTELYWCHAR